MASLNYAANVVTFYAAYGEYHSNRWNILVHMIFVPTIVYSLMGLMRNLSLGLVSPTDLFYLHSGILLLGFSWVLWIYQDFVSGLLAILMTVAIYIGANYTAIALGDEANFFFSIIQLISWLAQFVSHAVFENRKPALLDNILLTLAAPYFVMLEWMFLLGYKPDLKKKCYDATEKKVK